MGKRVVPRGIINLAIGFLEMDLHIAKDHNAWMEATPFDEVARVFARFGEAPPEMIDLEPIRQRIERLGGKHK
jgi:hypothetical protein